MGTWRISSRVSTRISTWALMPGFMPGGVESSVISVGYVFRPGFIHHCCRSGMTPILVTLPVSRFCGMASMVAKAGASREACLTTDSCSRTFTFISDMSGSLMSTCRCPTVEPTSMGGA